MKNKNQNNQKNKNCGNKDCGKNCSNSKNEHQEYQHGGNND